MHRPILAGAIRAAALLAAMLTGIGLATATQAAQPDKARVIVTFKAGAGPGAKAAINAAGGRVAVDLPDVNAVGAEVPAAAVQGLRRNPNVVSVDDDPIRRIAGYPASKGSARIALLPGTAEQSPYGIAMVQADQVTDAPAASRKVCIIDSGIDRSHEDLQGIAMDGVNLTKSGQWFTDENSHGTHVAGTIAAVDNTVGVVGVLPHQHINLFIAKVFDAAGSAPSSVIARAMIECKNADANVVNMSLGGDAPSAVELQMTDLLAKKGLLLIAAAGNGGTSAVEYPAGFATVVSVAAVDVNKAVASFSQFNADVELSGPGVGVLSTVPIGSQTAASVTVGAASYAAIPMDGSPRATATGTLADFGLGDTPVAGSMTGKVCLIKRGTITFAAKVVNCQNSGGLGAIIYNNTTGDLPGTLGETVTAIPSVGTTQADGQTMLTQLGQSATVSVFGTDDAYAFYNGTSMATPHVAGVAALVWSHFPHCTADQMRTSLDLHALDLGDPGRDVHFGFGLVQAKTTFDAIATGGCGK